MGRGWIAAMLLGGCAVDTAAIPGDSGTGVDMVVPERDFGIDACTDPTCECAGMDTDGDGTNDCDDGCPSDGGKVEPGVCGCGVRDVDMDMDGVYVCDNDCNDGDPLVKPGVADGCNEVDDDCDGEVDEDCAPGCADETREGYVDTVAYPSIAACAGGWSVPGIFADGSPSCARRAGNDGANPEGDGCDIDDLCADGWHVCDSPEEVEALGEDCGAAVVGAAPTFFAASVSGQGSDRCSTSGSNNVFGCGNSGSVPPESTTCSPLNQLMGYPCSISGTGWTCSSGGPNTEADTVVKDGPDGGGALCCRD